MSEKEYVEKTLSYCEKILNLIAASIGGILVYLFMNYDGLDKTRLIVLIVVEVLLVIAGIADVVILVSKLSKYRKMQ